MIGGLPVRDMKCDICGLKHWMIWLQDDLTLLCNACLDVSARPDPRQLELWSNDVI